ncbi:MAG: hypothetical protein ACFFDX_15195 [Candidatus Odinarchaeota archaeon]
MNRIKTKKIALLTTVALLILCFLPTTQAYSGSSCCIKTRPIEDWLYAGNPFGSGPGFADPNTLIIQRLLESVFDADSYKGSIVEWMMKDGTLLYYLCIEVKGIAIAIRDIPAIGTPEEWIFVGETDYTYRAMFILEKEIPGGLLMDWDFGPPVPDEHGNPQPLIAPFGYIPEDLPDREPGADLPVWWILYYYAHEIGGHFKWLHFKSYGSGYYIEPGWNPPFQGGTGDPISTGEEGKVVVNQMAFYSNYYASRLGEPHYYQSTVWSVPEGVFYEGGPVEQSPLCMPEYWPLEDVILY